MIDGIIKNAGTKGGAMRLPVGSAFPQLNRVPVRRAAGMTPVTLDAGVTAMPEMSSDLVDAEAGYAVENVRRDRAAVTPTPKLVLANFVGRMLGGGQGAVRP